MRHVGCSPRAPRACGPRFRCCPLGPTPSPSWLTTTSGPTTYSRSWSPRATSVLPVSPPIPISRPPTSHPASRLLSGMSTHGLTSMPFPYQPRSSAGRQQTRVRTLRSSSRRRAGAHRPAAASGVEAVEAFPLSLPRLLPAPVPGNLAPDLAPTGVHSCQRSRPGRGRGTPTARGQSDPGPRAQRSPASGARPAAARGGPRRPRGRPSAPVRPRLPAPADRRPLGQRSRAAPDRPARLPAEDSMK